MDNSSSVHVDCNKKRYLSFLVKVQQGLDCTSIMIEAKYSIIFLRSQKKFCISLTYNGSDSFLFVNTTKTFNSRQKTLTGLDMSTILLLIIILLVLVMLSIFINIWSKAWYKIMFGFIKTRFIELLCVCAIESFGNLLVSNWKFYF